MHHENGKKAAKSAFLCTMTAKKEAKNREKQPFAPTFV
jgi:hypothetical protein